MEPVTVTTVVTVVATVRDRFGALADPTTLAWTVRAPDGTETTPPSTDHPSVGVYELDVRLDQAGKYKIEAQADGAVVVAGDCIIPVRKSAVDRAAG